jgi:hypothetical protein
VGIFGRADQDDNDDQGVLLRALAGQAAVLARLTESVAQLAGRLDEVAELQRRQGIRIDRADPAGRVPDVADHLRAEEAKVSAVWDWNMSPAGRAQALIGAGLDGGEIAAQLQRERAGLFGAVATHDPAAAGVMAELAELDAASQAERAGVRHGQPVYGDGTE